mmetsp:Transcript_3197/g.8320  ORF Transcript_3197/g.8320 Transcript_3197/m.8320 type:complete len:206 (+) Transcript_3197:606-1223(+)
MPTLAEAEAPSHVFALVETRMATEVSCRPPALEEMHMSVAAPSRTGALAEIRTVAEALSHARQAPSHTGALVGIRTAVEARSHFRALAKIRMMVEVLSRDALSEIRTRAPAPSVLGKVMDGAEQRARLLGELLWVPESAMGPDGNRRVGIMQPWTAGVPRMVGVLVMLRVFSTVDTSVGVRMRLPSSPKQTGGRTLFCICTKDGQ